MEHVMQQFIIKDGPGMLGAHQTEYRFPNGYGASVIRGGMAAYGGLEMAVLKFTDEGHESSLCYDTPVTNDVLGYLNDDSLAEALQAVADLPHHFMPERFR